MCFAMFRHVLTLLLAITLAGTAAAQTGLRIEQWTTAAGSKVLFVRAPSIPMLDINLDFDAGGRHEPNGKAGLASLTMAMLAKGAAGMDEAAIALAFAQIGAQRGGGASDDRASFSLRTLTSPDELSKAVELSARILGSPQFPQAVFAREKERIASSLKESLTKPESIVRRTFSQLAYAQHPYGVDLTIESVNGLSRDDMAAFFRQRYNAKSTVVAMIGAISRLQAQEIADKLTGALPNASQAQSAATVSAVVRPERAIERRIAHPASQSHILIGAPAIARGDPDFFALIVGNYILGGGGLVSRLSDEVREKRGLAYSVSSSFSPALDPGPFTISLQTRKEQTDQALSVVRDTVASFLKDGPSDAELAAAKANLVGGFALRIDSNRKILDNLSVIGYYQLPLDYLDTWSGNVARVSAADIRAAFARHVQLDRLITVVVGAGS